MAAPPALTQREKLNTKAISFLSFSPTIIAPSLSLRLFPLFDGLFIFSFRLFRLYDTTWASRTHSLAQKLDPLVVHPIWRRNETPVRFPLNDCKRLRCWIHSSRETFLLLRALTLLPSTDELTPNFFFFFPLLFCFDEYCNRILP